MSILVAVNPAHVGPDGNVEDTPSTPLPDPTPDTPDTDEPDTEPAPEAGTPAGACAAHTTRRGIDWRRRGRDAELMVGLV